MNHIQKLADRAKKSVPHGLTPDKWIEVYNEKLAELIVRECADLFEVEYGQSEVSGNEVAEVLKKHFGVEE